MKFKARHALLVALLSGVMLAWFFWDSPERAIRILLAEGESAVEAKNIAEAMVFVSRSYHDESGLNYFAVRRVLGWTFARFQSLDVRLYDVRVEVRGERASASGQLQVLSQDRGERVYLLGTPLAAEQVSIALVKETLGWKVTAVNGIDRARLGFQDPGAENVNRP